MRLPVYCGIEITKTSEFSHKIREILTVKYQLSMFAIKRITLQFTEFMKGSHFPVLAYYLIY